MSIKYFKLFVLAILILLLIPVSFAFDADDSLIADSNSIYVSTTGNDDSGNGLQSNPYKSISKAVEMYDSSAYSNIYVEDGQYNFTSQVIINKAVSIVGSSRDGVIFNGNNQTGLFKITTDSKVVLSSLSFVNGYISSANQYTASAIAIDSSTNLTIDNCLFADNKNGAVSFYDYWSKPAITIKNSEFLNNDKTRPTWANGGAIYINGEANLNIYNTTFNNNVANSTNPSWTSLGGAVYITNKAKTTIDSCRFISNSADSGSAIAQQTAGDLTITNSIFKDNIAFSGESLIYDSQGNPNLVYLNLANNTFENNSPDTVYTNDNVQVNNLYSEFILKADNINMNCGSDIYFTVSLTDSNGLPLGGKVITVSLTDYYNNLIILFNTTDSEGKAHFSLKNQKPGKYKTVSSYSNVDITNRINIKSESEISVIFTPDYVKMMEGESVEVTGRIVDEYFEPEMSFDGSKYSISWLNNKGTVSVIDGAYFVESNEFNFDLSRCHLVTQNKLYNVNFTISSDYYGKIVASLPVDVSSDMPPVSEHIEVIYVSSDGSDETGDGTISNPLKTPQMALYVNKMFGGGKTIHIMEGQYNISIYNLLDDVSIEGEGSKTVLSQDSGRLGMFSIYNNTKVTFTNLTFTNGFATPVPSSLLTVTENAEVTINNCEFYGNYALRGGVISVDGASVIINSSYFHDNAALLQTSKGGAVWITAGNLEIYNSLFENNQACDGGALYLGYDAYAVVENSTFKSNSAIATTLIYGGGGAIYSESLIGTDIRNSSFISNYADLYGGAIYIGDGVMDIDKSYFENNTVGFGDDKGSAIHAMSQNILYLNITYSVFVSEDELHEIVWAECSDENETFTYAEDNYWGGNSPSAVQTNIHVSNRVIIQVTKDISPVYAGDSVRITTRFMSTNSNGEVTELNSPVHDFTVNLTALLGEVSPKRITLANNVAEYDYYANNHGMEQISYSTEGVRHYVYQFDVANSSREDANPIIKINSDSIEITLPSDLTGQINININGNDNYVDVINGHATFSLASLAPGNHPVVISYSGDSKYKGFVNETSMDIDRYISQVDIEVADINYGQEAVINVNVTSGAGGVVTVRINNKNYTITLKSSKGSLNIANLNEGSYTVYANYTGDDYYKSSQASKSFTVRPVAQTDTIYVSINGNDTSGDGSKANPYATVSKALDVNHALGGNKTVIVNEGTFILNRYSLTDSVRIIGNGTVISASGTNHMYIGGDVDVYLEGLTFVNGKGYTSGSIDMGSSANKNLTVINCSFINNTGPVGAVVSYANTKIISTAFINNTATGSSGSVQGIVNVRSNTLDMNYCVFLDNIAGLAVYSAAGGNVDYNFWGSNNKPDDVDGRLTLDKWVIVDAFTNSEVALNDYYDINIQFKDNTFEELEQLLPDVDVKVTAEIGELTPATVTINKNTGIASYISYNLGNETVKVYIKDTFLCNLTFGLEIPESDKIYVSKNGSDLNDGSRNYPLKTLAAAIAKNSQLGGFKYIFISDGTYTESDLVISDDVSITASGDVTVKSNIGINSNVVISSIKFDSSQIMQSSANLTIKNSIFTNSKIYASGNSLNVLNSIFNSDGISVGCPATINNVTFNNIADALTINGDADISASRFTGNDRAIVINGNTSVSIKNSEFNSNRIAVDSDGKTTDIENSRFSGNVNAVITKNDGKISGNIFNNNTESVIINGGAIDLKNNTIDKKIIRFNGDSLTNIYIILLNGQTSKVDARKTTITADITDDMGNLIDGGVINITSNGNVIGQADVIDGIAKLDYDFAEGDYTISAQSTNYPDSKITSGKLRVGVKNCWFINNIGYETLAEAVEAAKDGDVIRGIPGEYVVDEIDIGQRPRPGYVAVNKSITVTSLNDTPVTIKTDNGRAFFIDSGSGLTLENVILTNCHNDGDTGFGGTISVMESATLKVVNCTFTKNSADTGGVIYSLGQTIIKDSIFEDNTAGLIGGAVFKDGNGDLIINNSTFKNSYATSFGGAIHLLGDERTSNIINNSRFISNTGFRGGAIYAGRANLTVDNSEFISNNALRINEDYEDEDAIGGAFYNYYANVLISNSRFIDNHAQDCGGALELDNTVTSTGSYYDPTVTIYWTVISNCELINNTADDGGAIYMGYSGSPFVYINNTLFKANTANYDSAAIGNVVGFLMIDGSKFINNRAKSGDSLITIFGTDDLYNEYDAYLFIDSSRFENNKVNLDIYFENYYAFGEITNSEFINEPTIVSNRGFVNITNTRVKDSADSSKYVINNFGLLGLENNTFDNPIFSDFYISTPTYLVVLNNRTYSAGIGKVFNLTAVVVDDNGNLIEGCELIFIINGKEINATLTNHQFTAPYAVERGLHIVNAVYDDEGLQNLTVMTGVIIGKELSSMSVEAEEIFLGMDGLVKVTLDSDATGSVLIKVDDRQYTVPVKNGEASLTIPDLTSGNHTICVTYFGNDRYAPDTQTSTLSVIDSRYRLTVLDVEKYYHGGERLEVTLTDYMNNPIANVNVVILINGNNYTRTTDNNGQTSIALNLNSGNYTANVYYDTDDGKCSADADVLIKSTVEADDLTKVFRNASQYSATFLDSNGNKIAGGTMVSFNINGVFYNRTTDDDGIARLNINLEQGKYILTAINPVTGEMHTNIITVVPRVIENHDVTKYYRNGTQYTVKLIDENGNPVAAGVNVTFNINGIFYTRTTDERGYGQLNINLQPGDYIITAEYANCRVSNNIKVLSTLIAGDLEMHEKDGSQFEVKLVDSKGNNYPNQEITFNINGMFYSRVTDADGIARLNINLMKGAYIITSSYEGLNMANKITIS